MAITKDKIASLVVFVALGVAAVMVCQAWGVPGIGLFVGLMVGLLGLTLIWFAEPLGEVGCFSRGIAITSPPFLIESFGWLFLVGYPVLLAFVLAPQPIAFG